MAAIITIDDLISRIGINELLDLADLNNEEDGSVSEDSATETRIQAAIDEADEMVKSYIRGTAKIDDWETSEMPKILRVLSTTLALYFLQRDGRRETLSEDDHRGYKDACSRLQDYSTGKAQLSITQSTSDVQDRVITTTQINVNSTTEKIFVDGGYL